MNPDEKELLDAVFAGEPGAFETLIERYRALIYSVFHRPPFHFPSDYMDDLFQSFIVALAARDYRKLRAFEGRNSCSLATFLQIVTTRFALDEKRKWRRHPRGLGQGSTDDDELSVDLPDPDAEIPDEALVEQEQLDIFHNLLFSLEWKRISAVLWVFRDVTREHIAEVMSTSRANIDALYKRAKDQMTDLYGQGGGASKTRVVDPEVVTPEILAYQEALLRVPSQTLYQALLQPDAKERALLGLVLAEYPRFRCSKSEIARICGSKDISEPCLDVLAELAARVGVTPASPRSEAVVSDR